MMEILTTVMAVINFVKLNLDILVREDLQILMTSVKSFYHLS